MEESCTSKGTRSLVHDPSARPPLPPTVNGDRRVLPPSRHPNLLPPGLALRSSEREGTQAPRSYVLLLALFIPIWLLLLQAMHEPSMLTFTTTGQHTCICHLHNLGRLRLGDTLISRVGYYASSMGLLTTCEAKLDVSVVILALAQMCCTEEFDFECLCCLDFSVRRRVYSGQPPSCSRIFRKFLHSGPVGECE